FTVPFFLRQQMKKRIQQYTKKYSWRVLSGIMLGEGNILPGEIYQDFIVSGVVHILAVSGLHVGLVLFIFLGVFSLLGLPKKSTYLLTIVMIFLYVQMTGARPSAVRAFLMAALGLGAYFFGRDRNLHHSLYLSALIILFVNPRILFSIGFQFSYLATIGILYLSGLIRKLLTPLPVWLRNTISVSLGAQIMIYPLIAYYFNQISLIAPLANIFVVPLVGIIVTLGFSTCIISLVSSFFAGLIGGVNSLCILFLIKEAEFFASLPLASVKVSTPSILFLVVFYSIILCLINSKNVNEIFKRFSFFKFRYFFLFGVIIVSLIFIIKCSFFRSADLKIAFLSLRKGNSIFLEFPDGKNMLIGVGGTSKAAERVLMPFLLNKRIKKINTVVIMRDDPVHTRGLGVILNNFEIKEMVFNSKLGSWDIPFKIRRVKRGDWLKKEKELAFQVLNPEFFRNNRNDSLVLHLAYKDLSILFAGDIGKRAQKRIVNNYDLKVKILQIPDQKGGGILRNFLWEIFPECAIITFSGKAKTNFLRQLEQISLEKKETLKIYSTKEMGALEITTNGKTYEIKGYRGIKGQ
ncbi:ComEC/Rec2 family competence protein, partial [bacterium]|nr:ComEC/Rec2 family competence protein [bacterium]